MNEYNIISIKNTFGEYLSEDICSCLSKLLSENFYLNDIVGLYPMELCEYFQRLNCDKNLKFILIINEQHIGYYIKELGKIFNLENDIFVKDKVKLFLLPLGNSFYKYFDYLEKDKYDYTFKLLDPSIQEIKDFFDRVNLKYYLKDNCGDVLVQFDINGLSSLDIDKIVKSFILQFKKYIYAERNVSLEKSLVETLFVRRMMISCAESFTGGNIAKKITSIPGSSNVFYESCVTYSEIAKENRIGVPQEVIEIDKPVSAKCAYEMCYGVLKDNNTDIAVATTGIAGPSSDSSHTDVGICFIAIGSLERISVFKFLFKGSREQVISQGTRKALFLAIKELRGEID